MAQRRDHSLKEMQRSLTRCVHLELLRGYLSLHYIVSAAGFNPPIPRPYFDFASSFAKERPERLASSKSPCPSMPQLSIRGDGVGSP